MQHRVSIDRFTGGALPTALFNQQPAIGLLETVVTLGLRLRAPEPHEIGLLLLLLKDLWTGDLPLGGESSVGRGRLRGRRLMLRHHTATNSQEWEITPTQAGGLAITNQGHVALENYVGELLKKLGIQRAAGGGAGS